MAGNPVLEDEEKLLKVYRRRLIRADNKFEKGRSDRDRYWARYANDAPETDQVTEEGHVVSVTSGTGIVDTMYASMTAVDVEFIARNIGHGSRLQGMAATTALNQAWRDAKGQQRAKDAIKDAILADIGWAKVYYDYQSDVALADVPEEALQAQLLELSARRGVDPENIPEDDPDLVLTREVEVVVRDRVCIDYVPWDMVRADPSAKRPADVRWIAQYTSMPVYEVQNNPTWAEFVVDRYGDVQGRQLLEDLRGDSTVQDVNHSVEYDVYNYRELDKDEYDDDARITVVEMWDFETGLVTVFPKSKNDLILHQRANHLMVNADMEDRSPFKPLIVRKDGRRLEGIGDMRVIFPALEELDNYRTNLATYIERTIPKIIGPEEAMTQKGKDALKSPVWGEFIGVQGTDGNAFQTMTPPAMPQEAFQIQDRIQIEMKDGTGVSEPMRGVFPSKRTTATETQIVTDRGDMRQSERRSALVDWYVAIARCMLQLMQTYYDRDRMLRYTDDLGNEFQWDWSAEDIAMDADIEVTITPKENLTRDQRVQRFLLLMNLALPLPEADRAEFLRTAATEMGYRYDDIRPLIKSQQEVEMERQQQQVEQLAARPQPAAAEGLQITPVPSRGP